MSFKQIVLLPGSEQRFWKRVDRRGEADCWLWTSERFPTGYGRFKVGRRTWYIASRVAWLLAKGEQPDGLVCHRCDKPLCVNPAHLFLGTPNDNVQDMIAKGRARCDHTNRVRGRGRKTRCVNGHEYTPENTYWLRGQKFCRVCNRNRARQIALRRKQSQGKKAA